MNRIVTLDPEARRLMAIGSVTVGLRGSANLARALSALKTPEESSELEALQASYQLGVATGSITLAFMKAAALHTPNDHSVLGAIIAMIEGLSSLRDEMTETLAPFNNLLSQVLAAVQNLEWGTDHVRVNGDTIHIEVGLGVYLTVNMDESGKCKVWYLTKDRHYHIEVNHPEIGSRDIFSCQKVFAGALVALGVAMA